MKKALALLLALLMMAGLLAGCGGGNEENPSTEPSATTSTDPTTAPSYIPPEDDGEDGEDPYAYELPLTEEDISFTYWIPNSSSFEGFSTYDDNLFYQWMEEQTGIDIIFEHPASGSETEAFQTMILSESYPEFVHQIKTRYNGGVDKAIADGVLLRLNEYVDQYMPHYRQVVYGTEETFIQAVSDAGNLWGVHHIVDVPQGSWIGLGVREDWLTKAGLTVEDCATIDGVEASLTAMKEYTYENKGPLWVSNYSTFYSDAFVSAYGIGSTLAGHYFSNVDGKVEYGPIQQGAQEYAAKMADWYAKGLINTDYIAAASFGTPQDRWVNGECGIGDFVYTTDEMYKASAAISEVNPDPDFLIQALTAPTKDASQDPATDIHFRNTQGKIRPGNSMGITVTALPNIELACKFWDFAWTEEGKIRSNWGTIGEKGDVNTTSYIDETDANGDGHVECYQEWTMQKYGNVSQVQTKCAVHNGPTYSIWSREWCTLSQRQIEYQNIWNRAGDDWVMPEGLTLTVEEGTECSSILANANSTWHEWLAAVITGAKSADTFQTEVVDVINGMGIDTAVAHYQAALDRYNKRIEFMNK